MKADKLPPTTVSTPSPVDTDPILDKPIFLKFTIENLLLAVLLLLAPMLYFNGRILKNHLWKRKPTILFTLNNLILSVLCGLFVYWGFFDVI